MLNIVLDASWIVGVAQVSARLKAQLAAPQRRDQRVNTVRNSEIALQRTDPESVAERRATFRTRIPNFGLARDTSAIPSKRRC
jgi:hypothetical protein